jgi:hypothetical protein
MNSSVNLTDQNSNDYSSLLTRCKHVFNEIKEGHEKEAREKFPLEYYLINKYLYSDLPDLMLQLEKRLAF